MDVPPDFRPSPEPPATAPKSHASEPACGSSDTVPQPPARSPDALTFEEIRERAYELWERNHRPEGFEIEFWLLAERELRKERDRRKSVAAPTPPNGGTRVS